jgi:hypothetical protein
VLTDLSKLPPAILAVVELKGTQNTLPSGNNTPPIKAPDPGYVPEGVVKVSVTGL